jgi:hypothetical protein
MGIVITMTVVSKWVHRNDFALLKTFLAEVIDVQGIGNTP